MSIKVPNVFPEVLKRPLVVSAPGKVIFFGEHSVVYGKRSLAFSLSLRTELTICAAKDCIELHLPEINIERSWPLSSINNLFDKIKVLRKHSNDQPKPMSDEESNILRSFIGIASKKDLNKGELGLIAFFYLYTSILAHPISFSIKVKSQMPVGAGLGSSAAYAVCLAAALMKLSDRLNFIGNLSLDPGQISKKSLELICEWAFCCEKILHGTPSGIDNSVCTYGGCVSFKSGKIDHLVPPSLTIMLVNTRVSRNTKTLVGNVREKYNRLSSILDPLFTSMDNLAESALLTFNEMKNNSISNDNLEIKYLHLCELIDMNQCLLSALGVSHPSLDEIVATAKKFDFHAKLTGAGGGGFGIILLPPNIPQEKISSCKEALTAKGFETWVTVLGGPGLTFSQL